MVLHLFGCSRAGGLYNIGSGKAETWNSLGKAVFDALGKEINIEYIDMPEHLKDRYQYYTKAEMEKFYNTGYTREIFSLQEAVRDYVVNYLLPGKYLGD